mgnify:CR=1 FL=1
MNNNNFVLTSSLNYIGTYEKKYIDSIYTEKLLYTISKRIFDIIISLIGIVIFIPFLIIIKVLYLLTGDTKPIIFRQDRIGKNGQAIKIYKFRTMVVNAEELLEQMMNQDPKILEEYLKNKKLKNDPRLTKIGKHLRKLSIDEFPQFINILKGDMSVVGPRPYLFREKEDMGFYFNYVIKSKPGLTGIWQVSGRSNTTFEKRLKLDKYYENNKGIKLDLEIFLKTFYKVLKKEGSR